MRDADDPQSQETLFLSEELRVESLAAEHLLALGPLPADATKDPRPSVVTPGGDFVVGSYYRNKSSWPFRPDSPHV